MLDLTNTQPAIDKLKRIEGELNIEMIERTDAIRAILIALITGQHGVFLGPPGTGVVPVLPRRSRGAVPG